MPRWERRDYLAVVGLVLLVAMVKGLILMANPILARDGVLYLRFASALHAAPTAETLRAHPQHPLYPALVALVAGAVEWLSSRPLTPETWQACGHGVASVAGCLLTVPLYCLGLWLGDRRIGLAAGLLVPLLPAVMATTTDVLAESTALLAGLAALCAGFLGLRRGWIIPWFLAGAAAGLAYLARAEAAVITLALGLGVVLASRVHGWRWSLGAAGALLLATSCVVAPYPLATGHLSNRPSLRHWLPTGNQAVPPARSGMLLAERYQAGVNGQAAYLIGWGDAVVAVAREGGKAFFYVLWVPFLIGSWQHRRQATRDPALFVLWSVPWLILAAVTVLAWSAHYVSERHLLLVVVVGSLPMARCLVDGVDACARRRIAGDWPASLRFATLLLLLGGGCALQSARPLHASQRGHQAAGHWLARHMRPQDHLVDPYQWASFYAGRETARDGLASPAGPVVYVVIDTLDNDLQRQAVVAPYLAPASEPVFTAGPRIAVYRTSQTVETVAQGAGYR